IDLTAVEAIEISMSPNREVTLEVGEFALTPEAVDDEILAEGPIVDEFGQWIAAEWPEKITSREQLKSVWAEEDTEIASGQDFGFSRYGGWKARKQRATGFFHKAQVGGRWWLVDPDGYLFYSNGLDCVRYNSPTLVKGREKMFAKLPPVSDGRTDFYEANATARHGEAQFAKSWKQHQSRRLLSWGFNTV
ncbi:MAG: hypothetical protein GY953_40280, partial [bacterium]|nr:hypothetical protein [bacterium]